MATQLGQLAGRRGEQASMTAPAPIAMPWRVWARTNSLGVNFVWREIRARRLKVKMVGKRMLILDEDGRAFFQTLPEGPAAAPPANLERLRHSSPGDSTAEAETRNGGVV